MQETKRYMDNVVTDAAQITDVFHKISRASEEQSVSVSQVAQGADQISNVVQTNSATAEQSAVETEKPQETAEAPKAEEKKKTTYSWVNPKISGKTGEENNSASYTGKPEPSEAKAEQTSSAKTEHYQYQSQTQSAPKQEKPQFSAVPQPQDHKKKAKKPMSAAKKWRASTF